MKNGLLVVSGILVGLVVALFGGAGKGIGLGQAEAQAGPAAGGAPAPTMVLGTGGGSNNVNDLCWILSKVKPAKGPERTVLALYRAKKQGETFDLEDVRMIDVDLRVLELDRGEHKKGTSLKELLQKLPPEEQQALFPKNP
ncbi:MAG TPA: hypothetical protein VEN81_03140 [Planctomycetota bacterium]|nr:hypothetical protein [Planctomycetota bacterium]